MNKNQLQLIENRNIWQIDDQTKEIGREGLRNARSVLRSARVTDKSAENTTRRTAA